VDIRSIGAIILKVGGLLLIAFGVGNLPAFFSPLSVGSNWSLAQSVGAASVTLGPIIVLGVLFWFFPGAIVNKIVSETPVPARSEMDLRPVELVAISLVGVYLIARSVVELSYLVVYVVATNLQQSEHAFIGATIFSKAVAIAVELAVGLVICVGAKGIVRLLERARQ
jgi:hypothetical protein